MELNTRQLSELWDAVYRYGVHGLTESNVDKLLELIGDEQERRKNAELLEVTCPICKRVHRFQPTSHIVIVCGCMTKLTATFAPVVHTRQTVIAEPFTAELFTGAKP